MNLPQVNLPASGQILGILFSLIGAVLAAVAVRLYFKQRAFLRDAATAHGIVVDLKIRRSESTDSDNRTTVEHFSNPRVKFRAASGQEVTFESALGGSPRSYRVGDTVRVRYRPDRPAEAEIDAFWENWFSTVAAGASSGVLLVVGLINAIFSGRKISISLPMVGAFLALVGALLVGFACYLYLRQRKQALLSSAVQRGAVNSMAQGVRGNTEAGFEFPTQLPIVVPALTGFGMLVMGLGFLSELL